MRITSHPAAVFAITFCSECYWRKLVEFPVFHAGIRHILKPDGASIHVTAEVDVLVAYLDALIVLSSIELVRGGIQQNPLIRILRLVDLINFYTVTMANFVGDGVTAQVCSRPRHMDPIMTAFGEVRPVTG